MYTISVYNGLTKKCFTTQSCHSTRAQLSVLPKTKAAVFGNIYAHTTRPCSTQISAPTIFSCEKNTIIFSSFSSLGDHQGAFHPSRFHLHGYGRKNISERPISFGERRQRHIRNTKEERRTKEEQQDDAQRYCSEEMKEELSAIVDHVFSQSEEAAMTLTNMPGALEKLKIEVLGKARPLSQCGSFLRPSPHELIFSPSLPNILSAVLIKASKFDAELNPTKTEDNKMRFHLPRLTKTRRESIARKMKIIMGHAKEKISQHRHVALETIKELCPQIDYQNHIALVKQIDENMHEAEERLFDEMERKIEEIHVCALDDGLEDGAVEGSEN